MQQPLCFLLWQCWKPPTCIQEQATSSSGSSFVTFLTSPLLCWLICKETNPDMQENSDTNKGVWLKSNSVYEEKKGVLPELCSIASPLGPTITSPSSSSSSSCFFPTISSNFTNLCTFNMLLEKESAKVSQLCKREPLHTFYRWCAISLRFQMTTS